MPPPFSTTRPRRFSQLAAVAVAVAVVADLVVAARVVVAELVAAPLDLELAGRGGDAGRAAVVADLVVAARVVVAAFVTSARPGPRSWRWSPRSPRWRCGGRRSRPRGSPLARHPGRGRAQLVARFPAVVAVEFVAVVAELAAVAVAVVDALAADLVVAELVAEHARLDLDALAELVVVAELAPLDLAGGRAGGHRARGGGRRARHQRPARTDVLVVVAELAAVAMRWSPIAAPGLTPCEAPRRGRAQPLAGLRA